MKLDAHIHVIVPEMTREADPSDGWLPRVFWEGDRQVIDFAGKQIKSAIREFVAIDRILEAQDEAGIDRILACPWVSLVRYNADTDVGLRTSRTYNEGLARLAQDYPDRITALGTVPLQDPELAAREVEALSKIPGVRGVEVAASVNGVYLGDETLRPFWEAVAENDMFVFIHPTTRGFGPSVLEEYYMWNTVGNPTETTITAAHMVMSGLMESLPRLKVLLAHGGGTILSLRGRLRHAHTFQPMARAKLSESPEDSLKRFYFDTITHDLGLLRALVDFAGADHVLLGSDYPFDMGDLNPADLVEQLGLPSEQENLIMGGNAARLLGLE